MPKSCAGWGRAGVGLETSNAFSGALGDLVLSWASGALSLLLPPVRSVRSSHRQLTSQFHSLTPAARGLGVSDGTNNSFLSTYPPPISTRTTYGGWRVGARALGNGIIKMLLRIIPAVLCHGPHRPGVTVTELFHTPSPLH